MSMRWAIAAASLSAFGCAEHHGHPTLPAPEYEETAPPTATAPAPVASSAAPAAPPPPPAER